MLRIKYLPPKMLPNNYPVDKNTNFQPGQLSMLITNPKPGIAKPVNSFNITAWGNVFCSRSDGSFFTGIIDDIKTATDDSTASTNKITIWNVLGLIGVTDQFDHSVKYFVNQLLYGDHNGNFTNKPHKTLLNPLAILKKKNLKTIEFEWVSPYFSPICGVYYN